jgi:hypothetical protein
MSRSPTSSCPSYSSPLRPALFAAGLSLLAVEIACSSSSSSTTDDGSVGGPVVGPADNHCSGVTPIQVSAASCHPSADAGAPATGADAAASDAAAPAPAIMFNSDGDDDDCKYHVTFTSTPVKKNQNVTFNVNVTELVNSAPATGADIVIEAYLADNNLHPAPNNGTTTSEAPAGSGMYTVAPVKFDASGRWIVRFHFYETCFDTLPDSPHGHAAFYVDVP